MKPTSEIKIFKKGESILNTKAKEVAEEEFNTEKLITIVEELNAVAKELGAVGFAAPQIGYSKRVMMIGMEFKNPKRPNVEPFPNMTFINPEVLAVSAECSEDWEGCASVDNILAYVSRPVTIKYRARDPQGDFFEGELSGFSARVFLHEKDHLDGILMDEKAIETKERDPGQNPLISMKA